MVSVSIYTETHLMTTAPAGQDSLCYWPGPKGHEGGKQVLCVDSKLCFKGVPGWLRQ